MSGVEYTSAEMSRQLAEAGLSQTWHPARMFHYPNGGLGNASETAGVIGMHPRALRLDEVLRELEAAGCRRFILDFSHAIKGERYEFRGVQDADASELNGRWRADSPVTAAGRVLLALLRERRGTS